MGTIDTLIPFCQINSSNLENDGFLTFFNSVFMGDGDGGQLPLERLPEC